MTEAAAAEVHAHPDAVLLIHEQVDVMVAAANRAELLAGEGFELARHGDVPRGVVVEQLVVDIFLVLAPDPERQRLPEVIHNRADIGADEIGRASCRGRMSIASMVVALNERYLDSMINR